MAVRMGWGSLFVRRTLAMVVYVTVGCSALSADGIVLISKGLPGNTPAAGASAMAMTPDGRYVLLQWHSGGVAGITDDNGVDDVYRWDRTTGIKDLVSHASSSVTTTANGASAPIAISDDGQYVLFHSAASNLILGGTDANGVDDLFLWDTTTNVTLISHASSNTVAAANGSSEAPAHCFSSDGSRVVFDSLATDLIAGTDTNGARDVFGWNRATDGNTLISHKTGLSTTASNGASLADGIRADGTFVVFESNSNDLGFSDLNASNDVFLADSGGSGLSLVSHTAASSTTPGNGASSNVAISADDNFVGFVSTGTNLVTGGTSGTGAQAFENDLFGGTIKLVSHVPASTTAGGDAASSSPALSTDGRYVSFTSSATNLIAGGVDSNGTSDAFLYDRTSGNVALMSHAAGSVTTASDFGAAAEGFSANGGFAAFRASASNLIAGGSDTNGGSDAFLYDVAAGSAVLVSHAAGTPLTAGDATMPVTFALILPSSDGRYVAFTSQAADLVAGVTDANASGDAFLADRTAGTAVLVSAASGTALAAANAPAFGAYASADGRYVGFTSSATNLVAGGLNNVFQSTQAFLWDGITQTGALISHFPSVSTQAGTGSATLDALSADGRFATLTTDQDDLGTLGGDTNGVRDVYSWDRTTDQLTLVSHATGNPTTAADAISRLSQVSADGQFVAFTSQATDLVAGNTGPSGDNLYLWTRATGVTTLITHAAAAANMRSSGTLIAVSSDGAYVLFSSTATDLISGGSYPVAAAQLFLWQRSTGAVTLITHNQGSTTTSANGLSEVGLNNQIRSSLSNDGRYVLYQSAATDVITGSDTNGGFDTYLWDRMPNASTLVSHASGTPTSAANGGSIPLLLSQDGRFAFYGSAATNLIPSMSGPAGNNFRWDRTSNTSTLMTHAPGALTSAVGTASLTGAASGDGSAVFFDASSTGLISGTDTNGTADLYRWSEFAGDVILVTHGDGAPSTAATVGGNNVPVAGLNRAESASWDSQYFVLRSDARNLLPNQVDGNLTQLYRSALGITFSTVAPCRLYDTRSLADPIKSGEVRIVQAVGVCGIPHGTRSVSVNLTVVNSPAGGFLQAYPGDQPQPATSALNFDVGATRANNAVVQLALGAGGTIALRPFFLSSAGVDVVVDVNGYFE